MATKERALVATLVGHVVCWGLFWLYFVFVQELSGKDFLPGRNKWQRRAFWAAFVAWVEVVWLFAGGYRIFGF